jgi:MoxR-like ATPase
MRRGAEGSTERRKAEAYLEARPCKRCESGIEADADADATEGAKADTEPEATEPPKGKPEATEPDPSDVADVLASWPSLPEGETFHAVLPDVLLLAMRRIPVWMQGPPGTGKSRMPEQVAAALDLPHYSYSCSEQKAESTLWGLLDANGRYRGTLLRQAYEHGGVFVLDEIDAGNPNTTAGLNTLLSNGYAPFSDGTMVRQHPDFVILCNANTAGLGPESGYIGRMGVDLATRDRFVTVHVPIDPIVESAMVRGAMGLDTAADASRSLRKGKALLRDRAIASLDRPTPEAVLAAVRTVRERVEGRFRGSVVTPRCALHAAMMVTLGWALRDAIASKLPGIDANGVETVTEGIGR